MKLNIVVILTPRGWFTQLTNRRFRRLNRLAGVCGTGGPHWPWPAAIRLVVRTLALTTRSVELTQYGIDTINCAVRL